ncbi:MAG: primosomal protein N' [Candidatus Eremiobacteraeota bacterium]|nr:primosomal protein N' [Candidatus Eremiobacteraeota bacterium]
MVIEQAAALVDVVVDVQTKALDEPFTYSTGAFGSLPVGTKVRVPLGGRVVSGWVVASPAHAAAAHVVKPLDEVCDDASIPPQAVELARWLRRRFACTFREALSAVAPRTGQPSDRFTFTDKSANSDIIATILERRFGSKSFSSLAAARALRAAGEKHPLGEIRGHLRELSRAGILARTTVQTQRSARAPQAPSLAVLVDATAVKGSAQRRLVEALADAGGSLPLLEARRRSRASAAVARAAVVAGAIALRDSSERPERIVDLETGAPLVPTPDQRMAVDALDAAFARGTTTALLQGITGSGKTLVYAQLVDRVRARGGRAIVLVPEIALTPQTAGRFHAAFGARVGVLHSGLSQGQRLQVWSDAASGALDVVIGARSAVFAPLPHLQLIVVDEEHEASYKQDVAPRYHAAAVAIERMRQANGSVLLGSATPSLESYWNALEGRIMHVRLTKRATDAPLPPVEIVDMTRGGTSRFKRALGPALTSAIESRLAAREKTMLFVNRRGYAGVLLCRSCGFAPRCKRCAVSLVVHAADRSMRCHICGDGFRMPARCPKCASADLLPFGVGTQRVEEEIRELFPSARVVRMDSDSTGALGAHGRLLRSFATDGDILIGTQMIAKGLDYPTVTLVGVVAADLDLNRPDFRAAERTFSLLTQVAGRAGRAAPGSRVIVQAYAPEHYAIALAARHDYDGFAEKELSVRRELGYPPFGRLVYIVMAAVDRERLQLAANEMAARLRAFDRTIDVLGPAPDVLAKARGEYRLRIALKSSSEEALLEACSLARTSRPAGGVRATVIVDP